MTWRNRGPETEAAFKNCFFLAVILFAAILYTLAVRESAETVAAPKIAERR